MIGTVSMQHMPGRWANACLCQPETAACFVQPAAEPTPTGCIASVKSEVIAWPCLQVTASMPDPVSASVCSLLGRCHPIDPVTSVVGDVPGALSQQVCHVSLKWGSYDCGAWLRVPQGRSGARAGEAHTACSCCPHSPQSSLHKHSALSMLLGVALNGASAQLITQPAQPSGS